MCRTDPETLKRQLKEVLAEEEAGNMNPTMRLKKKALQGAYEEAIRKQMVSRWMVNIAIAVYY